jgi:hypothetical protein
MRKFITSDKPNGQATYVRGATRYSKDNKGNLYVEFLVGKEWLNKRRVVLQRNIDPRG